ncbi:MAG: FMN-binding negative transcriptional regulator [Acidobacteriaceae bacterium]|nr:FMN-binding negative transcriptional regulator [Acidobacteriaceae bacterium]
MYVPQSFVESDREVLGSFIRRYAFATVVSHGDELHVSHLPLLLLPDQGSQGTLLGHMARANDQWQDFDGERPCLCIFHGPHAYISPTWYEKRPAVPTWNYAVVHVTGRPRRIEEPHALTALLDRTMEEFAPSLRDPSSDVHPSEELRAALLKQIVGFEIAIERVEGKFKLGQNRSAQDRAGIVRALEEIGGSNAEALIELMKDADRRA